MSLLLSAPALFGRESDDPEEGWGRWLTGVRILVVGLLFVFGVFT